MSWRRAILEECWKTRQFWAECMVYGRAGVTGGGGDLLGLRGGCPWGSGETTCSDHVTSQVPSSLKDP